MKIKITYYISGKDPEEIIYQTKELADKAAIKFSKSITPRERSLGLKKMIKEKVNKDSNKIKLKKSMDSQYTRDNKNKEFLVYQKTSYEFSHIEL